jgi:oligopeptide/dipeptide ABC transporter ATP-binding protein
VADALLQVEGLTKRFVLGRGRLFGGRRGIVHAVDGVSFRVEEGETLGLVGESGSGKSTTARLILRLLEPTAGTVRFDDQDVFGLDAKAMWRLRQKLQIVFQDPYGSLNPRKRVGDIIGEPLEIYGIGTREERKKRVGELLEVVGLKASDGARYPHQFSGGQRQRIGVAAALASHPKLIVADEPVSALDVSVQAQILNLLNDLKRRFRLTYLFIAHDLNVVLHMSDRVAVMYLGKIAELGTREQIHRAPKHPYTQALLSAVPVPDPRVTRERILLPGEVGSALSPPSGCRFHPRCPHAFEVCPRMGPELQDVGGGQLVACHLYGHTTALSRLNGPRPASAPPLLDHARVVAHRQGCP